MGYQPKAPPMNDIDFINIKLSYGTRKTDLKFSIKPRICHASKKSIWLKTAYRVRHANRMGDYGFEYDYRWYSKEEYIKLRLMG